MSELHRERASTLGRIGEVLDSLLATLRTMRSQFQHLDPQHREAARERYEALYEKARLYRWYLEVQREAVGLTKHDVLDDHYPLPPAEP